MEWIDRITADPEMICTAAGLHPGNGACR